MATPTDFIATFNEPINFPSLTAGELTINGVPALLVTPVDAFTVDWKIDPASLASGTRVPTVAAIGADASGNQLSDVSGSALVSYSITIESDSIFPTQTVLSYSTSAVIPYGTPETLTATVSNLDTAAVPAGVVRFYNGMQLLGSATLKANGTATLTTAGLPGGADALSAVFQGSAKFTSSNSNTVDISVTQANTSSVLTSSVGSTVYGQPVTFQVTVTNTSTAVVPAGGPIQFLLDRTAGMTPIVLGTAPLVKGVATFTTSNLPAGAHTVTAAFPVNSNFAGSFSNAATQSINHATTKSTLVAAAASLTYGQGETLTATVTNTSGTGATPSGIVQFYDGAISPADLLGQAPVENGVAKLPGSPSQPLLLSAGNHTITAYYNEGANPTANFAGSASNSVKVTVAQATTSTALTASSTALTFGQAETLTATVTDTSGTGATPTGMVQFLNTAVSPAQLIGQASLVQGVASLAANPATPLLLAAGHYNITAKYIGTPNFSASGSSTVAVAVTTAHTTATLSSSAGSINYGGAVTFTVAVSNNSASTAPTGAVSFYLNNGSVTELLGNGNLSNGVATLTTAAIPVGTFSVSAVYAGTANLLTSTSNAVTLTVSPAETVTLFSLSVNGFAIVGEPITFTAAVAAPGTALVPSGQIAILDAGILVALLTLDGNGDASGSLQLGEGPHSLMAYYIGTTDFALSTSPPVFVYVL